MTEPVSNDDEYENNNSNGEHLNEDVNKITSLIFQSQIYTEDSNDKDKEEFVIMVTQFWLGRENLYGRKKDKIPIKVDT